MPRIERTESAKDDVLAIGEYIARDNPAAAFRVLEVIEEKCESLAANPRTGQPCPDLAPELRQFPVSPYPYIIFYRPLADGIRLIRVLHGRRDINAIFDEAE